MESNYYDDEPVSYPVGSSQGVIRYCAYCKQKVPVWVGVTAIGSYLTGCDRCQRIIERLERFVP